VWGSSPCDALLYPSFSTPVGLSVLYFARLTGVSFSSSVPGSAVLSGQMWGVSAWRARGRDFERLCDVTETVGV
jgi:hypothetical protein